MFKKELRYYFSTPVAYIAIGLYLLLISLFLWVIPGEWNIPQSGYADLSGIFSLSPWLFLLLCPALTMRLMTEERQTGTWLLLRSKPVPLWQIVCGKYAAALMIVVIAVLPCIVHYAMVYALAEPTGNVDSGAFFGAYIGLIFIAAVFVAVGMFVSCLTRSQIVAFIIGALACFIAFYGFDLMAMMTTSVIAQQVLDFLSINTHYQTLSRGVVATADVVYLMSVAALFVTMSIVIMQRKRC